MSDDLLIFIRQAKSPIFSILLLLLLFSPSAAQEETPYPVIDSEDIFAEGVTVLERLPAIQVDNELRLLYYFSPEANRWEEYAYPSKLKAIESITDRSDGSYFLNLGYSFDLSLNPERAWLFDRSQGIIPPPIICNLIQALPNEGEWRLARLDNEQIYRFCDTETGEYTAPIPDTLVQTTEALNPDFAVDAGILSCTWGMPESLPVASPNGRWILFESCIELQSLMRRLYAYDTETDTIIEIGNGDLGDYAIVRAWLDYQTPVIQIGDYRTGASHRIYTAKLSQANSLQAILGSYAWWPRLFLEGNLPRVMSVNVISGEILEADLSTGTPITRLDYQAFVNEAWESAFVLYADDEIIAVQSGYPLDIHFPLYIFAAQTGELLYKNFRATKVDFTINHQFLLCDWDVESGATALKIIRVLGDMSIEQIVISDEDHPCPLRHPAQDLDMPFSYNEFAVLANQEQYFIYDSRDARLQPFTINTDYQIEVTWHDSQTLEVKACTSRNHHDCSGEMSLARWFLNPNSILRGES